MNADQKHFQKALKSAYYLLKYRIRSIHEIKSRLRDKHIQEQVIDDVIVHLQNLEMLNDEIFTRVWIQNRLNNQYGYRRIANDLRMKGIDQNLIEREWSLAISEEDQDAAVQKLIDVYWPKYSHLTQETALRRMNDFLKRRGFPADLIFSKIKLLPRR